jgi:Na+/H+-dicarboxylate symporter
VHIVVPKIPAGVQRLKDEVPPEGRIPALIQGLTLKNKSTKWILASLLIGIISGLVFHWLLSADLRDAFVAVFDTVTHMFLNLIKMIIAPLIFATLVSGIAGAAKSAGVGKLFGRSMIWFLSASVLVGAFGFIMAHLLNVGSGLHLVPTGDAELESKPLDFQAFITNIIPTSVFSALTTNNPLQILVFGALFGIALLNLRKNGSSSIADAIDELMKVMLKVTGYVMLVAPVGVFAGIASAFTAQGLDAFATYASFIGGFYVSLSDLWVLMISVATAFLGRAAFRLVRMVREPMVIAFATSSSEAALPKLIEGLTKFGIEKRTTDFGVPAAGIAVLLVVDQVLDMGRTATNILGNAIATAVLGRKHGHATPDATGVRAKDAEETRTPAPAMH